ncbi:MAG: glycogen synthase GlgA [Opitutaceae bacterium]|nr:glycogen synthase GlgA [Opitutaceae bacterium]
MNIVHAASELFPFMKTGGLADAVGGLTHALAEAGHDVAVFIPGYRAALEHHETDGAERIHRLQVELGAQFLQADLLRLRLGARLTVYFVVRDEYFDRRGAYGTNERDYDDNAERFIFFSKAVVEAMRLLDLKADVVHAHDWQTALLPLHVRLAERQLDTTLAVQTVFTVHNLAFQGTFPMGIFGLTNLPGEFRGVDGLEFFGQINLMKAGLIFSDRVTTVSPTYAKEIQTSEFGCGLEGVVATRAGDLVGLLNGVDDTVWNPETDLLLPARYSADALAGKAKCRRALLKKCGFDPETTAPVYGMICRLTEQKGLDLLLGASRFFETEDCRLVVVGMGQNHYEEALLELAQANPTRIALARVLDEPMTHLVESGADFFLMPSVFEPCGLNQMYSQRYGTIPLCSRVGGLLDTVVDLEDRPEEGTGLLFTPTAQGLGWALERSQVLFRDKARMLATIRRGMRRDFSWAAAAQQYERLYTERI